MGAWTLAGAESPHLGKKEKKTRRWKLEEDMGRVGGRNEETKEEEVEDNGKRRQWKLKAMRENQNRKKRK